jgi:hypothetical protein
VVKKHSREVICVNVDKDRKLNYRLFKESKLPTSKSAKVQADIGYQGIQKRYKNSKIPHKGKRNNPLTEQQKK